MPSVTVVLFRQNGFGDKSNRNLNERAQKKSLGEFLMRAALAQETGFEPQDWNIGNLSTGQPVILSGPHSNDQTKISLSHSGSFFVAAASSADALGVDIEVVRTRRYRKIAEYLNWPESTWNDESGLSSDRFFQLWTLWEAAIKVDGGRSDDDTRHLFANLISKTTPEQASPASMGNWYTQSWKNSGEFWITVIARLDNTPQVQLYELVSFQSKGGHLDIRRLDDLGPLDVSSPRMAEEVPLR
jgi:phosphopantetheinyl transferase